MKQIIKNILIFLSYFAFDSIIKILLFFIGIDYYTFSINNKIIATIIIDSIYIILLIILYRKELLIELKDFKENFKKHLSGSIVIYLLGVLLMFICNFIISKITNQSLSGNEAQVREYIQNYPLFMIFSSVIYAPIVEELIFRKSVKNIFKYKYLFIIISGIVFGMAHVQEFSVNEFLFAIPYIIMGLDFAYIYHKTNNIFTTMTIHFTHNLILLTIQLL